MVLILPRMVLPGPEHAVYTFKVFTTQENLKGTGLFSARQRGQVAVELPACVT